jgi:hypothetical protein
MPLTKVKSGGVSDSITLTSPDINAPDIDGGTIDNAVIGGSTAAAGSFTTITATGGSSSNWNTAYGWGDHSTQSYATQTYVGTEVSNLVDSSPAALNTLNELAAALGDDPNFATTVTNSIALKAPLASPSFTGAATFNSTVTSTGLTVNAGTDKVVLANNFATTGNTDSPKLAFYSFGDVATYPVSGPSIKKVNTGSYGAGDLVIYQHGPTDFTNEVEALRISSSGAATFNDNVYVGGDLFVPNLMYHTGDLNTYMQFHGADSWRVVTAGAERLHIEGASVVVNEDSHDADFRVESNAQSHMFFVDGGANRATFGQTQASITSGGMYMDLSNGSQAHMGICVSENANNVAGLYINRQNYDGSMIIFRRNNVQRGSIDVTTVGTTYSTTSDRRLKKDIETITDGTDKLMAMNPVTHGWKADPEADAVHGFIAQEMRDIVPEAVSGDPEGEDMMSMDYGRITPVLVAALQDAHKKIAGLETRLNELEGK